MNRKNFLRNALMAVAVSLVPKILQPTLPEVLEEEMVDVPVTTYVASYDPYKQEYNFNPEQEPKVHIMKLSKHQEELVAEYQCRLKT